jgi:hypothetical protein
MSRSFKKNPIHGNTLAESEKKDKRYANRKFRKIIKNKIHASHYDADTLEDTIFPSKQHDASDNWLFSKDGKHYWNPKRLSKELVEYFKKIMRK